MLRERGVFVFFFNYCFCLMLVLFFPLKVLLCNCRMMSVVLTGRLDADHSLLQGITKDTFGPKKISLKEI